MRRLVIEAIAIVISLVITIYLANLLLGTGGEVGGVFGTSNVDAVVEDIKLNTTANGILYDIGENLKQPLYERYNRYTLEYNIQLNGIYAWDKIPESKILKFY